MTAARNGGQRSQSALIARPRPAMMPIVMPIGPVITAPMPAIAGPIAPAHPAIVAPICIPAMAGPSTEAMEMNEAMNGDRATRPTKAPATRAMAPARTGIFSSRPAIGDNRPDNPSRAEAIGDSSGPPNAMAKPSAADCRRLSDPPRPDCIVLAISEAAPWLSVTLSSILASSPFAAASCNVAPEAAARTPKIAACSSVCSAVPRLSCFMRRSMSRKMSA